MIMHMRLFVVLLLLIGLAIVVAMRHLGVVVLVRMPIRTVFPLQRSRATAMMVGDMVVVMRVCRRRMGMLGLPALAICALSHHRKTS